MKKSVFTLLAIATAVFTMSSCSKDDAGSNAVNTSVAQQTQTTQTPSTQAQAKKGDVCVAQFAFSANLADYGTFTLTISDGTDTKTVDLAKEGQKVDLETENLQGGKKTMSCYKYTFVKQTSKKLTFKTTFTPNDAAKQLTDKDIIAFARGCKVELTTDGKASAFTLHRLDDIHGNNIQKVGDKVAENLSKNI